MKVQDIMEYAKTHKKKIALTALGIVGGTVLIALGVKHSSKGITKAETLESREINDWFPEGFNVGNIMELWNEGEHCNAIVTDVQVKDVGALGEEFLKLAGVEGTDTMDIILGLNHKVDGI